MRLIFLGPPGSGKGTQADLLKEKYSITKLSTGDIFRALSREDNDLAKKVKSIMDQGLYLPDDLVTEVVVERISKPDCVNGFILDGFPRTLAQAKMLDEYLEKSGLSLDAVLNLQVSEDILIDRLIARYTCKNCGASYNKLTNLPKVEGVCDKCGGVEFIQRGDDNIDSVKVRMQEYKAQTLPLVSYYTEKNIIKNFDGSKNLDEVTGQILTMLASIS